LTLQLPGVEPSAFEVSADHRTQQALQGGKILGGGLSIGGERE
jgi:hypothetical protein